MSHSPKSNTQPEDELVSKVILAISVGNWKRLPEAQQLKLIEAIKAYGNKCRVDELEAIAPDMRTHPKYKGYVETSASGKWQPLAERIAQLRKEHNAN